MRTLISILLFFHFFQGLAQESWQDPTVLSIQKEPAHAQVLPLETDDYSAVDSRYFKDLRGEWQFSFYSNPFECPDNFHAPEYNTDDWGTIEVPANWELKDYGTPIYAGHNIAWQTSGESISPPTHYNPTGLYRKQFDLPRKWDDKEVYLFFGGVSSAFSIWLNGHFIGYSQDSKLPAEFNITPYLQDKNNVLAIKVVRWSDASLLEAQNTWHLSGIERSVFMYAKPKVHIWDYHVETDLDKNFKSGTFAIDFTVRNHLPKTRKRYLIALTLYSPEGNAVYNEVKEIPQTADSVWHVSFKKQLKKIWLWTAETPNLYNLDIQLRRGARYIETVRTHVGFREIKVQEGQLMVNGIPVLLKGVNRPEHHPQKGHAIDLQTMIDDMRMLKAANVNTVRSEYYPNDKRWYDLCDIYGLYVISEPNISEPPKTGLPDTTINLKEAKLERVKRMYLRDRNHPSIIIWSLGRETDHDPHVADLYRWLKGKDKSRPIQAENTHKTNKTDLFSPRFYSPDSLEAFAATPRNLPLIMSAYALSKGNSTGNLDAYWEIVKKHNQLQGGMLANWIDQGLTEVADDGSSYFAYEGDFGNTTVNSHGLLTGILLPNRTPKPAFYEVKKMYQPISFKAIDAGKGHFEVKNEHDFLSLKYFMFYWYLKKEGSVLQKGNFYLNTQPYGTQRINLPITRELAEPGEYTVVFEGRLRNGSGLLPEGTKLAEEQLSLTQGNLEASYSLAKEWHLKEDSDTLLRVASGESTFSWNKQNGKLQELAWQGEQLLMKGITPNFWRAPTDNDIASDMPKRCAIWKDASDTLKLQAFTYNTDSASFSVKSTYFLEPVLAMLTLEYKLVTKGRLHISYTFQPLAADSLAAQQAAIPELPRIGLRWRIMPRYNQLKWYGRGPDENYSDRRSAALIDVHELSTNNTSVNYVRPQENGYRTQVRWLQLTTGLEGLYMASPQPLSFSAMPYAMEDFFPSTGKANKHSNEVKHKNYIEVHLDYGQMGVGSTVINKGKPMPPYLLPYGTYQYEFIMSPYVPDIKYDLFYQWE